MKKYGYGTYGDLNTPKLRDVEAEASFAKHFQTWIEGAQAICDKNHQERFPMLDRPLLIIKKGSRYIKIIRSDPHSSVHAFVDRTNGDILKPASWKAPAKHARGNIFDNDNGLASMGEYGPAYLR